jgi:probable rRNA maturation factor
VSPGPASVFVAGRASVPSSEVIRAVTRVLRNERRRATISVAFVGRDRMRALNRQFTGRPGATDVLAFSLPGPGGLAGDVYVCPWVAARQARRYRIPVREEILRLVIHGTLHVLGWDHPEDERRTGSPMWRRQERYVKALR